MAFICSCVLNFYYLHENTIYSFIACTLYILSMVLLVSYLYLDEASKEFSFIAKEKIFSSIKELGDNIKIISYLKRSQDLENIVKKIYKNVYEYNQEDNFFYGIVISIPTNYVKNEIKEYKIVKEYEYTHIFISKDKDLFGLSILKPIKQEDIENIVKQLKDYIDIASKLIKEEDDS